MALRFFLGANSGEGFVTLYSQLLREESRYFISVKGGPGCGKATCIRTLAQGLGDVREWIPCSSDPHSLDGALTPSAVLLDGTPPHVQEPLFPGAGEEYLALPGPLDPAGLAEQRPALLALRAASQDHYARAYALLAAAVRVRAARRSRVEKAFPAALLARRGTGLLRREVPKAEGPGLLRQRFLEGMTPLGPLTLHEELPAVFPRIIALEDPFGLGAPLLELLRDGALARGQEVYACLDPLEPQRLRHVLLPGAGLAFVTRDSVFPALPQPTRRIHLDRMLPREALSAEGPRLRLLEKTLSSLLSQASQEIAAAHALHDRMEAIYRPHLPTQALDDLCRETLARLSPSLGSR